MQKLSIRESALFNFWGEVNGERREEARDCFVEITTLTTLTCFGVCGWFVRLLAGTSYSCLSLCLVSGLRSLNFLILDLTTAQISSKVCTMSSISDRVQNSASSDLVEAARRSSPHGVS